MAGDVNSFENIIDEAEESVDVYGSEPEESID
jgi:hypothetical protein